MEGLTDIALQEADEYLKIPMYGFTESFNLSVAAAVCLQHLSHQLRQENIDWQLSDEYKDQILLNWLRYTIDRSDEKIIGKKETKLELALIFGKSIFKKLEKH